MFAGDPRQLGPLLGFELVEFAAQADREDSRRPVFLVPIEQMPVTVVIDPAVRPERRQRHRPDPAIFVCFNHSILHPPCCLILIMIEPTPDHKRRTFAIVAFNFAFFVFMLDILTDLRKNANN